MKISTKLLLTAATLAAAIFGTSAQATLITYSGVLTSGAIDGTSIAGEVVDLIVEFTDDQVFDAGGTISSLTAASSSISTSLGVFDFDNVAYDDVGLGQFFGFTVMQFTAVGSDGTAGDDGNESIAALAGESITDWFIRVGDGATISFTPDNAFSPFINFGETFDGGTSMVTTAMDYFPSSGIASFTFDAAVSVPEPGTLSLLGLGLLGAGAARCRRKV